MSGYLQCLIDQYKRKFGNARISVEKDVYMGMVNDLIALRRHIQDMDDKATPEEDIPKKHIAFDFVGTVPGLMEYLKNLRANEGE